METEIPLTGGNATIGVVRVGDTVRKPWTAHSAGVQDFMARLRERGVDLPAPLGRDERGRQSAEFVAGTLAMHAGPLSLPELARVGALVREIHDASADIGATGTRLGEPLLPVSGADLPCHCDLAPWNLVMGERWVFIDWDGAALSTRAWDLAYAAQTFTLNDAAQPVATAAERLRAIVDGYAADLDLRANLLAALAPRTWAMHDMLAAAHREGTEPWGTMYAEGHGAHWRASAEYVERNAAVWRAALMS